MTQANPNTYFYGLRIQDPMCTQVATEVLTTVSLSGTTMKQVIPDNYHVTILYFGAIAKQPLLEQTDDLQKAIDKLGKIELQARRPVIFEGGRKSALVLEMQDNQARLNHLHQTVVEISKKNQLHAYRPAQTQSYYNPHLTLARFHPRDNDVVAATLPNCDVSQCKQTIEQLELLTLDSYSKRYETQVILNFGD